MAKRGGLLARVADGPQGLGNNLKRWFDPPAADAWNGGGI